MPSEKVLREGEGVLDSHLMPLLCENENPTLAGHQCPTQGPLPLATSSE